MIIATLFFAAAFAALLCFSVSYLIRNKSWPNFPVVGMLPSLALNLHRLHAAFVDLLGANKGSALLQFADVELLLSADPEDVRHIMQTNSEAYIKGDEWRKRFDFFGTSYFNSDSEDLKFQKVGMRNFLGHQQFHRLIAEAFQRSVDELATALNHASEQGTSIDLKDFLQKLMFRALCEALSGCEVRHVSLQKRFSKAISDAFEAVLLRFVLPCWFWRGGKWLQIGMERKASQANETLNVIAEDFISAKKKEIGNGTAEDRDFSFLKLCLTRHKLVESFPDDERILRQNFFALVFAGEDTTSTTLVWLFCQLGKHPTVEVKLVEEVRKWWPKHESVLRFGAEELKKMVYLHAALCETLRLFPPVAFEARMPVGTDILPSGHRVSRRTKVVLAIYAMGRMEHIWGEDCGEFKPERWITAEGGIKYEPPHKFFAFSAGQRMCPGKDIAFGLMKAATANILYNYHVRIEQNGSMSLKTSTLLQMKNDLTAKIKKRL